MAQMIAAEAAIRVMESEGEGVAFCIAGAAILPPYGLQAEEVVPAR